MNSNQCYINQNDQNMQGISNALVALLKSMEFVQLSNKESTDTAQSSSSSVNNATEEWQAFQKQVEKFQQFQHRQPLSQLNTPILIERIDSTSSPHEHVMDVKKTFNEQAKVKCLPIDSTSPPNSESNQYEKPWSRCSESLLNIAMRCRAGSRQPSSSKRITEIDCETVEVDLDLLGLTPRMRQGNLVLRLFGLFRQMHYYLNDVLPSPYSYNWHDNYSYMVSPMLTMLRNLSLTQQVKQATRQCKIFLREMDRVLKANKCYDLTMYNSCERLVRELRSLIATMDTYKDIKMDHSYGHFSSPFRCSIPSAERLEILLTTINNKIRQTHLHVHLFDWAVQKSLNRQEPTMYKLQRAQQQFVQKQLELQQQTDEVGPSEGALFTVSPATRNCVDHMVQMTETCRVIDCMNGAQNDGFNAIFYNQSDEEREGLIRFIG